MVTFPMGQYTRK